MKVKILRGTIVNGKPAFPGDAVDISKADAQRLVRSGKAELVDAKDVQAALDAKGAMFARNPGDLMGNDDPRVTAGGTQETPTELKNVTPPGTMPGVTPGETEGGVTTNTGAMGESEHGEFDADLDADFDDNLNDPLGLHPTGGLTTKSAKPIQRAEKR